MVFVLCLLSDDALYLYKVSWKYLIGFQSYGGTWFPIFNIFKGAQFCKKMLVWSLFSAYRLIMLYICSKFHENI